MNQMAAMIVQLRKEKNMTQKELAQELNVTDKAVSKWERSKSFPDISLLPKLATLLNITTDALLSSEVIKAGVEKSTMKKKIEKQVNLICKAIALAMGVATFTVNLLGALDFKTAVTFLSVGMFCLALATLQDIKKE